MELTVEAIAEKLTQFPDATSKFIDERANKLYYTRFSSGNYGRIFAPLIKRSYPNVNLNGQSTRIALAIIKLMRDKGYDYITSGEIVHYGKVEKSNDL